MTDLAARAPERTRARVLAARCRPTSWPRSSPPTAALARRTGRPSRSAARRTAEDLPGRQLRRAAGDVPQRPGEAELLDAVRRCFASLFTDRAIAYRVDMGFDHSKVALSVGVQQMVRSDLASAGVIFTLDTESGLPRRRADHIGLRPGRERRPGRGRPRRVLRAQADATAGPSRRSCGRSSGTKELKLVYDAATHGARQRAEPPEDDRARCSLTDDDVLTLARWAVVIEEHYSARRGDADGHRVGQGRRDRRAVHRAGPARDRASRSAGHELERYAPDEPRHGVLRRRAGRSGEAIGAGPVASIATRREMATFQPGEVLVTDITDPDWEPMMKTAARDRHRPRRANLPRRDRRPRAGHPGDRRAPGGATSVLATGPGGHRVVRRGRGRPGLRRRAPTFDGRGDRPGRPAAHPHPRS